MKKMRTFFCLLMSILAVFSARAAWAVDSDQTRLTLRGMKGVHVVVEDLQPNIMKYKRQVLESGLSRDTLKSDTGRLLQKSGIRVLTWEEMLRTPGRPILYINVNTHESERYWYGYDVRVELRQVVSLETNPRIKVMAVTWSINMTGVVNIGQLDVIRRDMGVLVGRFVKAYRLVNGI